MAIDTPSQSSQPEPAELLPLLASGSRRPVELRRDPGGVLHVVGTTWQDALYGLGLAQALDRRTQLFFGREVALGRSSDALANTETLRQTDIALRQAGIHTNLDRETGRLEPEVRADLQAFCDGINDGLAQFGRSLPMWLCGLRPTPWTVADILLMGNLLAFGGLAMGQHRSERILVELIQLGVHPDRLKMFYAPHLEGVDFDLIRQAKLHDRLIPDIVPTDAPLPKLAGSNAWAVCGKRTESGHAILASDPHLETGRLPATWYEVSLEWGEGSWLAGVCLPGTPLFSVARTHRLAWGVTYSQGDTTDLFLEDCRVRDGHVQYRRGLDWHDFESRREVVAHRGADATEFEVLENPQGTLLGHPAIDGDGIYLLSAWTGHHGGTAESIATMLRMPDQSRVDEAMQHLKGCPQPPLCWVLADSEGHIGRQTAGRFPKRAEGVSGLAPVAAWDEENLWQGWIDPDTLPSEYDPEQGYVCTANEHLWTTEGVQLTTLAAAGYRRERIATVLAATPETSVASSQHLQYDVYSLQAERVLACLWDHIPEGMLKERLAHWDRRYTAESIEATLYHDFYFKLLFGLFGRPVEEGGVGHERLSVMADLPSFTLLTLGFADSVLLDAEHGWWSRLNRHQLIRQAAQRVDLESAEPWGQLNSIEFNNAFLPGVLGHWLGMHAGRVPIPGCFATPHQGHLSKKDDSQRLAFAPSYHFVADLGEARCWTNLPGGASEGLFQWHYRDDLERWRRAQYKSVVPIPMPTAS